MMETDWMEPIDAVAGAGLPYVVDRGGVWFAGQAAGGLHLRIESFEIIVCVGR